MVPCAGARHQPSSVTQQCAICTPRSTWGPRANAPALDHAQALDTFAFLATAFVLNGVDSGPALALGLAVITVHHIVHFNLGRAVVGLAVAPIRVAVRPAVVSPGRAEDGQEWEEEGSCNQRWGRVLT